MHRRQQRLLGILAAVLLGLAALIRWAEPPVDTDLDLDQPVSVSPDQVSGLALVRADTTVVAERTDGGWLMTSPLQARADDSALDGFVGVLDRLEVGPVLEGLDPAIYGLVDPQATLTLTRTDGRRHTLAVGTPAPVGYRTYVTVDGGGVQLAEGHPMTVLGRPVDALRDRTVHRFAESTVTELRWRDEDRVAQVLRREGSWFLADGRRVSTQRVEGVLSALADLRLETFQDGLVGVDLAPFGLDPAHATLTLVEAGGESTLAIGGERAGGVLVRTPSGLLGTVGELLALLPPPEALLEDRTLPWTLGEATALSLRYAGVEVELTRQGTAWLRNGEPSPQASAHAVDLLTQLPADRSALADPGEPSGDRLVATAGAHTVTVELGAHVDSGRLAWSPGEPAFVLSSDALMVLENVAMGVRP